ncbi:hypothetical protein [Sulfurovum sp. NBC37-1]|uniref:hypothetical protein n=1 Tax=Sulfurovum sp. (strain NBC37-1) TaxID=387093 RepID=UPI0001587CB3|nr:hypothetical protein [Sulfurovum sp. NBC37-1]BAF73152.1 hypothetical protein SUN_2212 [Sulfurovum sp. NBC37-1]
MESKKMALFGLIKSKEHKLATKWEKEHVALVELAGKIIAAYASGDTALAKLEIKKMGKAASEHVMNEDLEFMKLEKKAKLDDKTKAKIQEFQKTFKKDKLALLSFLAKYGQDDSVLDGEFFDDFNTIIEVVSDRIKYEEENLYKLMKDN